MVPFKSKVSVMANLVTHLKSLGGHPPVEELCRCVTERYNQLVSSLDRLYAATQTQGVKKAEHLFTPVVQVYKYEIKRIGNNLLFYGIESQYKNNCILESHHICRSMKHQGIIYENAHKVLIWRLWSDLLHYIMLNSDCATSTPFS